MDILTVLFVFRILAVSSTDAISYSLLHVNQGPDRIALRRKGYRSQCHDKRSGDRRQRKLVIEEVVSSKADGPGLGIGLGAAIEFVYGGVIMPVERERR
ncbi:unnamed protein product [Vicia faba]|uniref:Uncharacterized protein n=1 Tax=Vicia faba TaxID=3906 RepID=A0AAV1B3E2_VICFA|nr:unnamed protein product [Vicia faba]